MSGLSASGLKTQIKSYTEVSDTVLTNDVLENINSDCTCTIFSAIFLTFIIIGKI